MELALAGVAFHSCRFYDVARVLIADSRAFQALAAILDYVTYLVSMSCWYRSDAGQDESQAALLRISKVRGYDHFCRRWSAKGKKKNKSLL